MKKQIITLVAALALAASGFGQVVFSDDMSGTFATNWTSGGTGIASFSSGVMLIDNNSATGQTYAYTDASSFSAPYNTALSSNPGAIQWAFNMSTASVNPSNSNRFAFVLAADGSNFTTANGYAVRIGGDSPSVDPLQLVYFTGGVNGTITPIASGESLISNRFADVRVVYTASTNMWELFGVSSSSGFGNPTVVTTALGSGVNNTATGSALSFMGAWSLHTSSATQDRTFDNFSVTAIPEPSTYAVIMGVLTLGVIFVRSLRKT